jgi:hypothetical protein
MLEISALKHFDRYILRSRGNIMFPVILTKAIAAPNSSKIFRFLSFICTLKPFSRNCPKLRMLFFMSGILKTSDMNFCSPFLSLIRILPLPSTGF